MLQPVWGWGGWGRSRVVDEQSGRDTTPTDGMWIIYLGILWLCWPGIWTTMMLLPSWMFVLRFPVRQWRDPAVAPLAAMATLLGLYSVDCLVNGFMNLSYVVASGGLIGTALSPGKTQRTRRNNSHGLDPADAGQVPAIVDEAVEMPVAASRPSTGVNSDGDSSTTPQGRLVDRYRQLARTLRRKGSQPKRKHA